MHIYVSQVHSRQHEAVDNEDDMAAAGAVWNRTGVVSDRESDRALHAVADNREFGHRRPRSARISSSDSLQRKHDVIIGRQKTWLVKEHVFCFKWSQLVNRKALIICQKYSFIRVYGG